MLLGLLHDAERVRQPDLAPPCLATDADPPEDEGIAQGISVILILLLPGGRVCAAKNEGGGKPNVQADGVSHRGQCA